MTYSTFGDEERSAMIEKVINRDRFSMGEHVKEFESQFANYLGRKYCVMANSGSSANLIAIAALFHRSEKCLKPGDEVIVPCISWATTYYPLHQYGLKMRFVDVDINTLNMDPEELRKAITPRTKMVVAVSILGNPCYFDQIQKICDEHNLILFEDNCESLGAKYNGKQTGTFGVIGTFSTFFSHHISTMEGGLVTTDDYEIYCLLKSLRNHGWVRDQDSDSPIYQQKDNDFYEAYRFILPGYNVRPGELNGVVGKEQLKKLDNFINVRRENAAHFASLFRDDDRFIIQKEVGESSWFSFTMIVRPDGRENRDQILKKLKSANIDFRIITGGNMLQHDVIKHFDYSETKSTNAELAHNNGFFVGNAPVDIRKEIDHLYSTLK